MTQLRPEIRNHRLGAFLYGFMGGLGLILIIWGLTSIISLPSRSTTLYLSLTLFGVLLFASSCCREAYIRGCLSVQTNFRETATTQTQPAESSKPTKWPRTEATVNPVHQEPVTTEQIREYPVGTEVEEPSAYVQE